MNPHRDDKEDYNIGDFYPDDDEHQKMELDDAGRALADKRTGALFEGQSFLPWYPQRPPENPTYSHIVQLKPRRAGSFNSGCKLPSIDQTWETIKSENQDLFYEDSPIDDDVDLKDIKESTNSIDYVVIDTNVFVKNFDFIQENIIYNSVYYATGKMYVPGVVIVELDGIGKGGKPGGDPVDEANARDAKKELNELSKLQHDKYQGQDLEDVIGANNIEFDRPISNDDKILKVCLHLMKNKGKTVHLLTLDVALRCLARDMGIDISPLGEYLDIRNSE